MAQDQAMGAPDVVTLIEADHREVERLFEAMRDDPEGRRQAVAQLRALMTAHSEAEEAVVYTALKPEMADEESEETDGDVIDEAFDEHAEAERLIEELYATDPASEDFDSLLMDVMESVNHHVEEEETSLLPRLREVCSPEEMQRITREFHEMRMRILGQEGAEELGISPAVLDPLNGVGAESDVDLRSAERTGAELDG